MFCLSKATSIYQITLFVCMGLLIGCHKPQHDRLTRTKLSQDIYERYMQGDTVITSDSVLLAMLPTHLMGYMNTEDKGSTFSSPFIIFSQSERIYHGKTHLSISISDYAKDSTNYLRFWDRFEQRQQNKSGHSFYVPSVKGFGWMDVDHQRQVASLACAMHSRYWVEIRMSLYNQALSEAENMDELWVILKLIE